MRTSATLQQVADLAGVSKSLASRLLNNAPTGICVSEATRGKVLKAAEELEYKPTLRARRPAPRRLDAIGVVYQAADFLRDEFFRYCMDGVIGAADTHQYAVTLNVGKHAGGRFGVKMVDERSVDGILLMPTEPRDPLVAYLENERFPFVVVNPGASAREDVVCCDDVGGARKAMDYLRGLGHARICHVTSYPPHSSAVARRDAYVRRMEADGLEPVVGPTPAETLREFVAHCVTRRKATAFFLCHDNCALEFYMACHSLGVSIPGDVSVLGVNDGTTCVRLLPQLTSVRLPMWEMGGAAVELLVKKLKRGAPQPSVTLDEVLIERDSCRNV